MASAYAGTGNQIYADKCSLSLCGLEEYNLSYNKLTTFPTTPFNVDTLKKFYLQGNKISNFTVSSSIFDKIEHLDDFEASPSSSSVECKGEYRTAHGVQFCVADSAASVTGAWVSLG